MKTNTYCVVWKGLGDVWHRTQEFSTRQEAQERLEFHRWNGRECHIEDYGRSTSIGLPDNG